jgi:hypothetical protein
MRVAGLVPEAGDGRSHEFDARTIIGASSTAGVQFARHGPDAGKTVGVAILCRQPDPIGSVRAAPETRRGVPLVHACRRRAALSRSVRGAVLGTVTSREPLAVLGSRRGWLRVQTDAGRTGWVRVRATC